MTRATNARLAGFMFLFYIATGIAGMMLPAVGHSPDYALLIMTNAFVLGVALYALTREYDGDLALLALLFRVAEGLIAVVGLLAKRAAAPGSALPNPTLLSATAFALGSTIFCYLFLKARSIPVALAWLGVIASIVLAIGLPLQIAGALAGSPASLMWIPMAVFEITFGVWLLVKGGSL